MKKRETPATTYRVIGNWKCNKTIDQARSWMDQFRRGYTPVDGVEVVLAPPHLLIAQLGEYLEQVKMKHFSLAAQDISPFPLGSYTGATAADMIKGICRYAIVGHWERRNYFHETPLDVVNKVSEAADASLIPIICVDETNAMSQLTALVDIDCDKLVVGYTPVDGSSYREPQSPDKIAEVAGYISQVYPSRPIIYGGGVNSRNYERYISIKGVSGLFLGAVSLQPDSFLQIVEAMQQRVRVAGPS
ncbi:MAG: triose-phosphate isomerase [Desulfofustis sp.]|nr:triose-phosphate isomerase [Desulfofustis sp.]MBT8354438.1 triose-phosphate isomerase [Desulfofustis sp.]NNF46044.1 triosephosphate isomerase [Desulfofustis sp.]NNK58713.1 triosephosphate isomerase [Desulfofustis sp.]